MSDSTHGPDDDVDSRLLHEADFLIRRHRPGTEEVRVAEPVAVSEPADPIPTLTDLVSPGRAGTSSRRAHPLPIVLPTPADTASPDADLERRVLRNVEDRLHRELEALISQRLLPELTGSIDHALGVLKQDLEQTLRAWIREAVDDVLRVPGTPGSATPSEPGSAETRPL